MASSRGGKAGWIKAALVGMLGLGGGAAGTYTSGLLDKVVKPPRPVANFAVNVDGLSVVCQNQASGESGWWDFGDGTPLEPFDATKPELRHTYTRPGSYAVKLTVRNFVADENERTVPVEVSPAGSNTAAPPRFAQFEVRPVTPVSVAPATFRVTADLQNADHCVWDYGDGRIDATESGKHIERLVTFDKPGTFTLQLIAHNGAQAVRQAGLVRVEAPREGTLMAVLTVSDTGMKVERLPRTETVAIPVPISKPGPNFTKVIAARPGSIIAEAKLPASGVNGIRNLKVTPAGDRRSITLTGDWAGDPRLLQRAAGGSDMIIPLALTEERTTPADPRVLLVTGVFAGFDSFGAVVLPIPPTPTDLANPRRELALEIRQLSRGGAHSTLKKVVLPIRTPGQPLWGEVLNLHGTQRGFGAVQEGETLKVTYTSSARGWN